MSQSLPPEFRPLSVYRRLLRYVAPHWPTFVLAIIGMAAFAATDTAFMALMKPFLDRGLVAKDVSSARWIPLAVVGLFLVRGIAGFMATYGMSWVGRRVVTDLRADLFNHLLLLPTRFYEKMSSGQLIARLTYHVEQVAEATTSVLTSVVKDGLTVFGLLAWMLYLNWRLAMFCFAVGPLIALVIRYVTRRFRLISMRIQDSVGNVTEAIEETIAAQRVVKIHNGQAYERERFSHVNERNRWLAMKMVVAEAGSASTIQLIAAFAVAAIIYFATRPTMINSISPGTFVSFMGAMLATRAPIKGLSGVNASVQRAVVAAAEVFRLMAEPTEPSGGSRPLQRARGLIEFRDVHFRYNEDQPEALRGISLRVEPGQTVAFVGRSGSGKSTLLALLPRFYDPASGTIELEGVDLREYRLGDLRAQIGLVDQQVRLFNATVAENIAYGAEARVPRERLIEAARSANAWEFIEKLPDGLDTRVGQNGVMLSGGQRQRLAIARALLRDAPILILDEATSALDTESERLIQSAIERLVKGRTTLTIAHRLSTIQGADLIVVLQEGRIAEIGRHADLLARAGIYAGLYRLQFEDHQLPVVSAPDAAGTALG